MAILLRRNLLKHLYWSTVLQHDSMGLISKHISEYQKMEAGLFWFTPNSQTSREAELRQAYEVNAFWDADVLCRFLPTR